MKFIRRRLAITIIILTIISVDLSAQINYQDTSVIKNVIYSWSKSHNNVNDFNTFHNLYGLVVFYYGKYTDRNSCVDKKIKFLNTNIAEKKYFHQEIISSIEFQYFKSGIIKCSFIKEVNYNQRMRDYPSYLLIKKEEGKNVISGESDIITDDNLKIKMDLGERIDDSNNISFKIFIAVSALILLSSIILLLFIKKKGTSTANNKAAQNKKLETAIDSTATNSSTEKKEISNNTSRTSSNILNDSEYKGYLFEKFIVAKFRKEYFHLIEWRSDKYHEGYYPKSSMNPDMEFMIKTKSSQASFAVECKWRQKLENGRLEYAKEYQHEKYVEYQKNKKFPVFIVIGIGGQPDSPNHLYIIPLDQILSTMLNEKQLKKYLRYKNIKDDFFYNIDSKILE